MTNPLAMVSATAVKQSAPAKLSDAAIRMAARGVSTRVETTVAIALAVSWKPLMKSKLTARMMTRANSVQPSVLSSGIFDYKTSQYVGNIFGFVGGLFHL